MTDKEYIEITQQYSDNVYRFLCKNLQDSEEAKDILQDSLVTLWNNRHNIQNVKAKSYLFTVAYHKMINVLNYNKIRSNYVNQSSNFTETEQQDTVKDYDDRQLILQAVELLSENARSCLLLKDWEGYKTNEISEIMGISEDNVKMILFRARRELRKIMKRI